jgi:hypothetical protein
MVIHVRNPNTQEAEAGESQVPGHPGLNSKALSQKKKKKINFLGSMQHKLYLRTSFFFQGLHQPFFSE